MSLRSRVRTSGVGKHYNFSALEVPVGVRKRERRSRVGMADAKSKLAEDTTRARARARANGVAEAVINIKTTELKISSSLPKTKRTYTIDAKAIEGTSLYVLIS